MYLVVHIVCLFVQKIFVECVTFGLFGSFHYDFIITILFYHLIVLCVYLLALGLISRLSIVIQMMTCI